MMISCHDRHHHHHQQRHCQQQRLPPHDCVVKKRCQSWNQLLILSIWVQISPKASEASCLSTRTRRCPNGHLQLELWGVLVSADGNGLRLKARAFGPEPKHPRLRMLEIHKAGINCNCGCCFCSQDILHNTQHPHVTVLISPVSAPRFFMPSSRQLHPTTAMPPES